MISLDGQASRTCEGLSRREWLRVGGLGTLGLGLSDLLAGRVIGGTKSEATSLPASSFGRAKSCIVLFMFGAPAHQDTWDLKPNAPSEVRGEFQPIASSVPDVFVSEHLPMLATRTDQFTQIRSVTHPDNVHTVAMHYMLTGRRHRRPATNPQNALDDFPCFGSIVNYVGSMAAGQTPASSQSNRATTGRHISDAIPAAVSLNAPANQVSANNHIFPGFFSGFLGSGNDPLFVPQHANRSDFDPLPLVGSVERLSRRQRLLAEFERKSAYLQSDASVRRFGSYSEQAIRLLTSTAARRAFDLNTEPQQLRQRYGMTPFGQGCLLARRLVEAGVSLVTVNWERDDAYWDTHSDNFNRHKHKLLPNLDRGFSALLDDLRERGLLDETLVVWLAEFGRTPKINKNAGRDHWAACNTVLLAGAGIPGGQVYGASDRTAAFPTRDPVSPEDLAATIYHLLGIDSSILLQSPDGQELRLSHGEPLLAVL